MTDIVAFLRAQLDADEATARDAYSSPWRRDDCHVWTDNETDPDEGPTVYFNGGIYRNQARTAAHIARHDPARVLAEVAAKRRLLSWVVQWPMRPPKASDGIAAEDYILRLLAQPYEGADGWDDAWKVER